MSSENSYARFQRSIQNSIVKTERQIASAKRQLVLLDRRISELNRRLQSNWREIWVLRLQVVQGVRCQYKEYVLMKRRKLRKLYRDLA